jgi:14-3-3 protein epsilon
LSVAYKSSIGPRRTAWRALSSIEKKEEAKNSKNLPLLKTYKKKIEDELNKFCNDIIGLLESKLVPLAASPDAQVFYLKMKGDYYRYISEYTSGDAHKKAGDAALEAYKAGSEFLSILLRGSE